MQQIEEEQIEEEQIEEEQIEGEQIEEAWLSTEEERRPLGVRRSHLFRPEVRSESQH